MPPEIDNDAEAGAGQAWRAHQSMGFVPGLKEYRRQLEVAGHPTQSSYASAASVLTALAAMTVRGLLARPRLKHAAGIPLLGRHVRLRGPRYISFGKRVRIDDFVEIQGTSTRGITLGNGVTLGKFVTIRPSGLYGRFLGVGLSIGERTSLGPNCFLGCLGGITIGSDVLIAPGVMIFAESHVFESTGEPIKTQGLDFRPVVVEDDCWLAAGAIITGGVRIGRGSIVGAGAVVTKDVAPGSVVAGNPAREIRSREAEQPA